METWFVEQYITGRLKIPDSVLDRILNLGTEFYYRFGRRLKQIPGEWSGANGKIVPATDRLMDIHYDQKRLIFENFLDKSMKYSMGLWETGADSLDAAQIAMMDDVCTKMQLEDGQSVLDIGCGFGSFASHVLERYPNCNVVGLTISQVQSDYIRTKQGAENHPLSSPRFRLIQGDFNDIDIDDRFDRIVSIGVFEHVWNMKKALQKISTWLNSDGACFLHYIVYKELISRFANVHMQDTFMSRNIFPDSRFWHERELFKYQEHLKIDNFWYLSGKNYTRTLESWRENFRRNAAALRATGAIDDRRMRVWVFYFSFTAALFRAWRGNQVGNGQYLLRHS